MLRNERLNRWVIALILTAVVAFLFFTNYWRSNTLPEKPEYLESIAFIHQDPAVAKEFGQISTVSLGKPFRYQTSSNASSGFFSFDLSGTKDSGTIAVYWTYDPETNDYSVTKLLRTAPIEKSGPLPQR